MDQDVTESAEGNSTKTHSFLARHDALIVVFAVIALFALSKLHLEGAYGLPAGAAQVPEYRSGLHVITRRFVDAVHNRRLQVHAWTINDEADMRRLIDLGVDGIITDYPDRLLQVLGR